MANSLMLNYLLSFARYRRVLELKKNFISLCVNN